MFRDKAKIFLPVVRLLHIFTSTTENAIAFKQNRDFMKRLEGVRKVMERKVSIAQKCSSRMMKNQKENDTKTARQVQLLQNLHKFIRHIHSA